MFEPEENVISVYNIFSTPVVLNLVTVTFHSSIPRRRKNSWKTSQSPTIMSSRRTTEKKKIIGRIEKVRSKMTKNNFDSSGRTYPKIDLFFPLL